MRQGIGRTDRENSESDRRVRQALVQLVNLAIAATGENCVAARRNSFSSFLARMLFGSGREKFRLNPAGSQDFYCRLQLTLPLFAATRVRIVEQRRFPHTRAGLYLTTSLDHISRSLRKHLAIEEIWLKLGAIIGACHSVVFQKLGLNRFRSRRMDQMKTLATILCGLLLGLGAIAQDHSAHMQSHPVTLVSGLRDLN